LVVHLQPTYDVVATFDLSLAAEALGHNGARNLTTYLLSVRAAYAARTSSGADGAGAVVCDPVKIRTLIALENPRPTGAGVWKNLICSAGGLNTPEYDAFIHAKDPFDMCRLLFATGTYCAIIDKNIHHYMRIWATAQMPETLLHLHLALPAALTGPSGPPALPWLPGPAAFGGCAATTASSRRHHTQRGLVKNPSFSPRWSL